MECNEVCSQLIGYLSDDLPPRLRQEVSAHLDGCYLCAEELRELSSVVETCRDVMRFPSPRNQFDALRPRLRKPSVLLPRPRHMLRDAFAGLAAACVVIACAWLLGPVVRTTVNLARLAERPAEPALAGIVVGQDAEEPSRMPMVTLLAWAHKIEREDPLSEDVQKQPQAEPSVETLPPQEPKPVSMRPPTHRGMLFAEMVSTRT